MKTPLEDFDIWIEIEHAEIPENITQIAKQIRRLNWETRIIKARYRNSLDAIFKSQEMLSSLISNFISLFQQSAELSKKNDESDVRKIMNDFINMVREISTNITNLTFRPADKLYPAILNHIKQLLAEPINSVIGPVMIESWRASKNDESTFYEKFYTETVRRAGRYPTFTVFKAPTKTVLSPILSSSDKRDLVLGLYEKIKNEKEVPENKKEETSTAEETHPYRDSSIEESEDTSDEEFNEEEDFDENEKTGEND